MDVIIAPSCWPAILYRFQMITVFGPSLSSSPFHPLNILCLTSLFISHPVPAEALIFLLALWTMCPFLYSLFQQHHQHLPLYHLYVPSTPTKYITLNIPEMVKKISSVKQKANGQKTVANVHLDYGKWTEDSADPTGPSVFSTTTLRLWNQLQQHTISALI